MRLRQLAWYKAKILIPVLIAAFFVGCGVFGGVSIKVNPSSRSEASEQPQMTLTIPANLLTKQAKQQFSKLIDESIRKFSQSKNFSAERIENLKKFSLLMNQAATEEELYVALKAGNKIQSVEGVLFTGYYKPLFQGSIKRSDKYLAPLYSYPSPGPTLSRKELVTSGALKGRELVYLKDPFEAYLAEIQGSVGIVLESGEVMHFAFAGSNNQKYVSIGSELVSDGRLTKTEATIPGIKGYFESHPGSMQEYIHRNPRMVFFRKSQGKTLGSSGVELLSERTVATDRSVYPPGSILFVSVEVPLKQSDGQWGKRKLSKFMIALDSGSAITGPNRIDLFLGEGSEVGEVAGRLNSRGKLEVFR